VETKKHMNSSENADGLGRRLLSLLDLATGPGSSGHVDDDTLALLTAGAASADELGAVRAHVVVCPPCRRLVGQILCHAEPSPPAVLPARTREFRRRAPALMAWAMAACVLLAASVGIWSWVRRSAGPQPGPQPGPNHAALLAELLPAPVTWERSALRGTAPEPSTITFKFDSPQDGIAVVLMVANGHWQLFRGERPTKMGPGNDYGPIEMLPAPVVYIVVVSDYQERDELTRTIRESLPSKPRDIEDHFKTWRDDVRARLTRGGHHWVSIELLRVEPAKPDPVEGPAPAFRPGQPSF
jgi:hypothetical protein